MTIDCYMSRRTSAHIGIRRASHYRKAHYSIVLYYTELKITLNAAGWRREAPPYRSLTFLTGPT